jgi:hypothetical protein
VAFVEGSAPVEFNPLEEGLIVGGRNNFFVFVLDTPLLSPYVLHAPPIYFTWIL